MIFHAVFTMGKKTLTMNLTATAVICKLKTIKELKYWLAASVAHCVQCFGSVLLPPRDTSCPPPISLKVFSTEQHLILEFNTKPQSFADTSV